MKSVCVVDANVVIRMLRGDHPRQSASATRLFKRAENEELVVEITDVTVAEIIWVLTSYYKVSRPDAANALLRLLGNPGVTSNAKWLMSALELFRDTNVDAVDCFLAAHASTQGRTLISFDKDFRKFRGLDWQSPNSY